MKLLWSLLLMALALPVSAAVTETELMQVAVDLGHRYDATYGEKSPAGMASLYARDGILVSPSGAIIRGRDALQAYYVKRFASGAHGHAIKILEVHPSGEGGYSIADFSVTSPDAKGVMQEVKGHIVAIYQHDADGWHLSLVEPTIPER